MSTGPTFSLLLEVCWPIHSLPRITVVTLYSMYNMVYVIHKVMCIVYLDVCYCCGVGDGNFLFTASKVLSPDKMVVGLNTDPYK